MASVGPVDARTESVPSTNPRTYAPESPIYRDAGGKLNGRKPSPAPTIATSSSATVGCEDAAAIDAIVTQAKMATPSATPSRPSTQLTALVTATIQMTVTMSPPYPKCSVCPH